MLLGKQLTKKQSAGENLNPSDVIIENGVRMT